MLTGLTTKCIYLMISTVAADSMPAFKLLAAAYSSDNQSVSVQLSCINQGTEHQATLVYKILSTDLDTAAQAHRCIAMLMCSTVLFFAREQSRCDEMFGASLKMFSKLVVSRCCLNMFASIVIHCSDPLLRDNVLCSKIINGGRLFGYYRCGSLSPLSRKSDRERWRV